ncbi:hypothetical protein CPB85DRAFT_1433606 [Mucidula mucida]|nr:hypothetical protein CPB85DRAFT_1433606 [Mucidula mucida]
MDSKPRGPWLSVTDFHAALVSRARIVVPPEVSDVVWRSNPSKKRIRDRIEFDQDYNVTGIIDWEASAWLSEYWEYTKALFLPWNRKGWWYEIMTDVFAQYEMERRAEYYIWKYREIFA